jgi:hypothetical protein
MTRSNHSDDTSGSGGRPPQYPRRRIAVLLLAAALAILLTFGGGRNDVYGPGDQAYRLAVADSAPVSQSSVHAYAQALDQADKLCIQGPRQISGMMVLAVRRAEIRGERPTHLGLLETLTDTVHAQPGGADCAETIEAILQQRGL